MRPSILLLLVILITYSAAQGGGGEEGVEEAVLVVEAMEVEVKVLVIGEEVTTIMVVEDKVATQVRL